VGNEVASPNDTEVAAFMKEESELMLTEAEFAEVAKQVAALMKQESNLTP